MKISIVIPNFNDKRIEQTLESIINQTYRNFEVIVVEGCLENKNTALIYGKFPIDKLIHEKDNGIFDALNKGIKASTGDIIYLMGADDHLSDNGIFQSVQDKISQDAAVDGVCIGCEFSNSEGKIIRKWYPSNISPSKMTIGILPPHFSLFLRKEMYDLNGLFSQEFSHTLAVDILWMLDLAVKKKDLNIQTIPAHHLVMGYGGTSTGSYKTVLKQFKIVHKYAKLKKLKYWPIVSLVRTSSKLFQFRIFS